MRKPFGLLSTGPGCAPLVLSGRTYFSTSSLWLVVSSSEVVVEAFGCRLAVAVSLISEFE